jgi:hypothetical protein
MEAVAARRLCELGAPVADARAAPGRRVGYYQDPGWVDLQVDVQSHAEMWALDDCVAIHRLLRAVEGRASYLNLSTANTCRVFSPHPDMATQPHQDAHYVRMPRGILDGVDSARRLPAYARPPWRCSPDRIAMGCAHMRGCAARAPALGQEASRPLWY